MKILVVIQDYLPEVGAGPARISEFAAMWRQHGHEIEVMTTFPSRRLPASALVASIAGRRSRSLVSSEVINGVSVLRSWSYAPARRSFVRTLLCHLSFAVSAPLAVLWFRPGADLVIGSGPPFFSFFASWLISRLLRVPLVLDVRDLWPDYLISMGFLKSAWSRRLVLGAERWLFSRAALITTVTESSRQRVLSKGVASSRTLVVPNGVDDARYYPGEQDATLPHLLRRKASPIRRLGYIGTFGRGQDLPSLVEAISEFRAKVDSSIQLVLVGDGSDTERLRQLQEDLGGDALILSGPIDRDATRAFYCSCDVVLVPHAADAILGETVPSKLFEAMACARPVLAVLRGEGASVVSASGGGLVVSPGDRAALISAVKQLLELPDSERVKMGQRGRQYVATHFARRTSANRLLQAIDRLVDNRR